MLDRARRTASSCH